MSGDLEVRFSSKHLCSENNNDMTAIELNSQLLRELSYISDNESYLQKTLDFIKKLTKSNGVANVKGPVYTEMLERLSDYQEFERGWDGDDALPLNKQVVKNFKNLLQKCRESELKGWTIFPAANGTLLLQNKERKSGINIGSNGYSYYAIIGREVKGENNLKFSPKSVIEVMKRIFR